MSALKICGAGILCLAAVLCVKNLKENFTHLLRFAATVIFIGAFIGMTSPLVAFADGLVEKSGVAEYGEVLFKALGISYLTYVTSQICRDCGETSIASGVENVGRIELLLLALPLFGDIVSSLEVMLSW